MSTRQPLRIALVTGGAGGIGREICQGFIARDIHCIVADIQPQRLNAVCEALGPLATPFCVDMTDRAAIERLRLYIETTFGRLDILVNNAAIINFEPFETRTADDIAQELNVNLVSPLLVTHTLLPLLRRGGQGHIINTVSLGGIFPMPESTVYSAAKFGLRGAMLSLGLDGPRLGVKVSSVLPSATETPMLMREAIGGGNALQFMDPPQLPSDVAVQVMRMLDEPCLERYPRLSESWVVRLVMLWPNLLPRLLPLLHKKGERGHQRYLASLRSRGILTQVDGKPHLNLPL